MSKVSLNMTPSAAAKIQVATKLIEIATELMADATTEAAAENGHILEIKDDKLLKYFLKPQKKKTGRKR